MYLEGMSCVLSFGSGMRVGSSNFNEAGLKYLVECGARMCNIGSLPCKSYAISSNPSINSYYIETV